jgi:FlaA1/EpsC-like NDP-sugar epimerase
MSAYVTGRVIVVGDNDTARKLIKNTENDKTAKLIGVIWPGRENPPGQFEGYPILGTLPSLSEILRDNRASLLLVATKEPWYSYFIESLPILRRRHLSVKWVKPELLTQKPETLSADIPLEDFHV